MHERVLCYLWFCDWTFAISPDYHANSKQKGQTRVYQRRPCAARYDLNGTAMDKETFVIAELIACAIKLFLIWRASKAN